MTAETWYSDEALRKQALADDLNARGVPVPLDVMVGILEPRVQPTEAEQCANCGCDARDEVGGEAHGGKRWCGICIGRGRHTQYLADTAPYVLTVEMTQSARENAVAVEAVRDWCAREAALCTDLIEAGTCESEGDQDYCADCVESYKARLRAIAEVQALLPEATQ